ncbi:MAG: hypothetical protein ABI411_15985 [Tahibacter sp.]
MLCIRSAFVASSLLLLCSLAPAMAGVDSAATQAPDPSAVSVPSQATTSVSETATSNPPTEDTLDEDGEYKLTDEQMSKMAAYQTANAAYQHDLARDLRESGVPRDWALASQLWPIDSSDASASSQARELLLDNAAAAAPDDGLVQWLWANSTFRPDGTCGSGGLKPERVESLLAREPDNAAVWLMALHLAVAVNDEGAIDAALVRIAGARRIDTHFVELVQAWRVVNAKRAQSPELWAPLNAIDRSDALAPSSLSAQEQEESRITAFAFIHAGGAPSSQGGPDLVKVCNVAKDKTGNWQRFSVCGDAARTLTRAGDLLTRLLGYDALRVSAQQTPEDASDERQMRWIWQQASQIQMQASQADGGRVLLTFWRDWLNGSNEVDLLTQQLRRAGVPLVPPPMWKASTPRSQPSDEDSDDEATIVD